MGYIFDALSRSVPPDDDGQEQPTPPSTTGSAPTGNKPAETPEASDDSASHAGPADPHADQATPGEASQDARDAALPGTFEPVETQSSTPVSDAASLDQRARDYESVAAMSQSDAFSHGLPSDPDFNPLPRGGLVNMEAPGAVEPINTDRHIELNKQRLKKMDDRIVMLTDPGCQFAEEYRSIRTSLLARWQNKRNLVHVITSATPQEGKTITSLNLGLTLAELRSRRTIIVEADLRLPAFSNLLRVDQGPGLVAYLRGEVSLEEATHRIGEDGAYLLSAGDRAFDDAVSLLSSSRMNALIDTLRQRFDHVIIDTPPVIELADAGVLGGLADDVLLIARMRRTSKRLIDQAIRTLSSYNAPVGGLIATDHQPGFGRYYAYRYRYRYRYGYRSRYHDYRKQSRKAA